MSVLSHEVPSHDGALYNEDLAPLPPERRHWGWFEIFNVWNNDIQSLFGYTLAASLFLSYGLNGWLTFAAIVVAGLSLFVGQLWARVVGVILALVATLACFAWLPYYPFWALLIMTLQLAVIWALTAHGRDIAMDG